MKPEITIVNPDADNLFMSSRGHNTSVKLTPEDQKSKKIKILSNEPYAQELYDEFSRFSSENGQCLNYAKDLNIGQICNVRAVKVSLQNKMIIVKDVNTQVEISIPFKEFSRPIFKISTVQYY